MSLCLSICHSKLVQKEEEEDDEKKKKHKKLCDREKSDLYQVDYAGVYTIDTRKFYFFTPKELDQLASLLDQCNVIYTENSTVLYSILRKSLLKEFGFTENQMWTWRLKSRGFTEYMSKKISMPVSLMDLYKWNFEDGNGKWINFNSSTEAESKNKLTQNLTALRYLAIRCISKIYYQKTEKKKSFTTIKWYPVKSIV